MSDDPVDVAEVDYGNDAAVEKLLSNVVAAVAVVKAEGDELVIDHDFKL